MAGGGEVLTDDFGQDAGFCPNADSDFGPYPGFRVFPYREYSEAFFGGGYKVLRGGSWAADGAASRGTFRNWDYPIRRQIFTGFRTARDAAPARGR
ncbi:SUMF1/EgtB/PvdO family nonheme iron enzyme [Arthrobacter sp. H14]|uniref:SUMF1/EgtB/PvdO family nonheme iron enzyme n=1 Tax=Arthrobacter sp. H14 TaxID=1312959 RepID=UPI00047B4712|nr:SUMF1/EgtB/PvdO family nonheme iron enzyme [Arthrobacter sp. H14]